MSTSDVYVVLAARNPEKLANFYAILMGSVIAPGMNENHFYLSHQNGTRLEIYRPSVNRSFPKRGQGLALCFAHEQSFKPFEDIQEWSLNLVSNGARVLEPPKLESFGAEAWLLDPEGNPLILLVGIKKEQNN